LALQRSLDTRLAPGLDAPVSGQPSAPPPGAGYSSQPSHPNAISDSGDHNQTGAIEQSNDSLPPHSNGGGHPAIQGQSDRDTDDLWIGIESLAAPSNARNRSQEHGHAASGTDYSKEASFGAMSADSDQDPTDLKAASLANCELEQMATRDGAAQASQPPRESEAVGRNRI